MTRSFSPGGVPAADVAAYYRRRAEGGVGLIITEGLTCRTPLPGLTPTCRTSTATRRWLAGATLWKKCTQRVERSFPALACRNRFWPRSGSAGTPAKSLVRQERFELPTFGSVDRRSNPAELLAHAKLEVYRKSPPGRAAGRVTRSSRTGAASGETARGRRAREQTGGEAGIRTRERALNPLTA